MIKKIVIAILHTIQKTLKISKGLMFNKITVMVVLMGCFSLLIIYKGVEGIGSRYLYSKENVPQKDAILILGAYVFPSGNPSLMLYDRLMYGLELYNAGKAPKIIVSGDHGREEYDEVNVMKDFLMERGVPGEDIFMDHAGFNTYDSLYRAKNIFCCEDLIVVSQDFHVLRALYIAKELDMNAVGVASNPRKYSGILKSNIREIASRPKAFLQAEILKPKSKYLGEIIPISGSGQATDDRQ